MAEEIIEKSLLEVPDMAQVIIFYEINRFLLLTCYAFFTESDVYPLPVSEPMTGSRSLWHKNGVIDQKTRSATSVMRCQNQKYEIEKMWNKYLKLVGKD